MKTITGFQPPPQMANEWFKEDGELTSNAIEFVGREVEQRIGCTCKACGSSTEYAVISHLLTVTLGMDVEQVPIIAVVCQRCGNYLFFNPQFFFKRVE